MLRQRYGMTSITVAVIVAFVALGSRIKCEKLPSYIKPCPKTSNLTACLIENIMSAVPHIKNGQTDITQSFDPFFLPSARMDKEWLTFKLKDVEYPMFHDWEVKNLNVDLDEGTMSVTIYARRMSGYGFYAINGTLFGLELNNSGTVYGNLADLEIGVDMKGDYKVENGGRRLILKKTAFRQKIHSGFLYMTNLYPEDPFRTLRANHVLSQNIPKVMDEIDALVDNVFGNIIFNGFRRFFEMYDVDDLFTD